MIDRQNGGRAAHVLSSASGGTSPSTSAPSGPTALTYRYFLEELRSYCGLLIGKGNLGASRLALLSASPSSVSIHSAGKSSVSLVLYFKTNSKSLGVGMSDRSRSSSSFFRRVNCVPKSSSCAWLVNKYFSRIASRSTAFRFLSSSRCSRSHFANVPLFVPISFSIVLNDFPWARSTRNLC